VVKKNNLFELIQSLTPSEKRFFRQSIAEPGKNESNYLRLFNEIEKMDSYDDLKIKKRFKGEKFTNQLHVTKIYLHEIILKALRNYHGSLSVSMALKNHLQNIEIYFNKELYNQCALEIQKAEKTALRFEDDIALLEISNWNRKLSQTRSPQDFNIKKVLEIQKKSIERLLNVHDFWQRMISDPLHTKTVPMAEPLTLGANVLSHHIQYREAIQHRKNDIAKSSLLQLITILEKQPHRIEAEPAIYLSTMNNLLSFLVFTKKTDEALSLLPKVKMFFERIDDSKRSKSNFRLILRTYNIELEIYRDTESLEHASHLIDEIQKLLSEHQDRVPSSYLISLWFQFAYIFFLRKQYKSALRWINEILNSSFGEQRKDLHFQTHLLNLMVHLELRNFFVMRYFVDSTRRLYKKNHALKPHHKFILLFFNSAGNQPESNHKALFEQLHHNLFSTPTLIPNNELDYIDWKKWISEKISRH
jgi:tetratricopeptide (TPR) repeat protein